jgi:hypothetical protein
MEKTGKLRVSMCEFTTIMECHKYNGYPYYRGVYVKMQDIFQTYLDTRTL